jgi:ATP-dependent Clp protease adaptor protein ClpS
VEEMTKIADKFAAIYPHFRYDRFTLADPGRRLANRVGRAGRRRGDLEPARSDDYDGGPVVRCGNGSPHAAWPLTLGRWVRIDEAMPQIESMSRRPRPKLADDDRKRKGDQGGPGTAVITKTKPQTKRPNLYRVLLLNDDYTPMEFVVHVLERFFNKDREAATRIMMHVHQHGIGECGVYTYEVAETKVTQVMDFARKHQHPLQCVMEKK